PSVRTRNLGSVALLLVTACRGAPPPGTEQARSDSALTARTWGLAYLQQQQLPRAEAEFQKVVALAPDQALGYADLGLVYLREGRSREAEAQLRRAAALDSSNNEIVLMLAEVYRLSGREADARHELDRVLHSDSTDIRALYALARLARRRLRFTRHGSTAPWSSPRPIRWRSSAWEVRPAHWRAIRSSRSTPTWPSPPTTPGRWRRRSASRM